MADTPRPARRDWSVFGIVAAEVRGENCLPCKQSSLEFAFAALRNSAFLPKANCGNKLGKKDLMLRNNHLEAIRKPGLPWLPILVHDVRSPRTKECTHANFDTDVV